MIKFGLETDGLADLSKRLDKMPADMAGKNLRNAMMKAAKVVQDDMKANVPVGTESRTVTTEGGGKVVIKPGFTRSRIKRRSRLNRSGRARGFSGETVVKVDVGVYKVPYIGAIEFGNSRQSAKPFIRRSLIKNQDKVISTFRNDLASRLLKVGF